MANMVFDKQAAKMLGKRRRVRRWVPVVACLVLVVMVGTFYFMIQEGQAMARKDMVLDCALPVHEHSAACFDGEEKLACGYANYVVHEHNDDCYDKEGALVCTLPEIREHHHVEACYEKREVLVCGQEQTVGHVHSVDCYEETLVCLQEEAPAHAHGTSCYDENHQLICGLEEGVGHAHGPDCYEKKLICDQEAGAGSHIHTDDCKETELILTCGKPEISLHAHTKECYSVLNDDGTVSKLESLPEGEEEEEKVLVLTCGMLQTERHEHGNECFRRIEKEESTIESQPESTGEQSSTLESSALESSGLESGSSSGLESGEGTPSSQPEGEAPQPEREPQNTYAYEDATLKVTAEGELPEGARLVVERLEDPQQLAQRQAKLKRAMEDEEYALYALLQVSLQDENGEQVPFEGPVSLQAEFFGEGVSLEGGKVCAVAFEEAPEREDLETVPGMVLDRERAQQLPVTLGESGGAVTQIEGDTLLGFGSKAPVKINADQVSDVEEQEDADANVLHISQSFSYDTGSLFHVVFHVEGDATLPEEAQSESMEDPELSSQAEVPVKWGAEEDSQAADSADEMVPSAADEEEAPADPAQAEDASSQPEGEASQPEVAPQPTEAEPKLRLGGAIVATGGILPANSVLYMEQPVEFVVEKVQPGEPAYLPYADYVQAGEEEAQEEQDGTGISPLEVMSYRLCYGGMELDLSDCTVTAEVRATSELETIAGEMGAAQSDEKIAEEALEDGEVGVVVTALEVVGAAEDEAQEGLELEETNVLYADAATAAAAKAQAEIDPTETLWEAVSEDFATEQNTRVQKRAVMQVTGRAGDGNENIMLLSLDTETGGGTLAIVTSAQPNPKFSVQYYAYLDMVDKVENGGELSVIDTSGASLPQNGTFPNSPTKNPPLGLNLDGQGYVQTKPELTEIYTGITNCEYLEKPNLHYFDALVTAASLDNEPSYALKQIWVLKDGASLESNNQNDWTIYGEDYTYRDENGVAVTISPDSGHRVNDCEKDLHFTNRAESATGENANNYIYIKENTVLRLMYEPVSSSFDAGTTFFDYAISNGTKVDGKLDISQKGINSAGNYKGTGQKYAFGNGLTTELENQQINIGGANYNINQANATTVYGKGTFGLVKSEQNKTNLDKGILEFSDGINAPAIFSGDPLTGKTIYPAENGNKLSFSRSGDTYTLSSATVEGFEKKDLDKMVYIKDTWDKKSKIYSNSFWPLDGKTDADGQMGGGNIPDVTGTGNGGKAYGSDDNKDHNNYFGMHFSVGFNLVKEYKGPLEYLFFGDDDMWVFLTDKSTGESKLICDIGGVHASVGEYVNLWDYIPEGSSGNYTLDFFYTERGASGSTCWMQFTLPSAYANNQEIMDNYGKLKVEKIVEGKMMSGSESKGEFSDFNANEEFLFNIKLTDADGNSLRDNYKYTKYNADGSKITEKDEAGNLLTYSSLYDGAPFTLKHGQYIIIDALPDGTKYTIWEREEVVNPDPRTITTKEIIDGKEVDAISYNPKTPDNDYVTTVEVQNDSPTPAAVNGRMVEGVIHKGAADVIQTVTYTNTVYAYELPKTGGRGVQVYIWAGAALLGAAWLALVYKISRKRGKEGEQKS